MKILAVYTTVASPEDARAMARELVTRGLAACAQITQIESIYRWQGELQQEPEFRLMFKSSEAAYPALEAAIRELHGYELPAIYAVDVERAYGPYAEWVEQGSTKR